MYFMHGWFQDLANITGSRAYERFTGSQIAKISESKPELYKNTEVIIIIQDFFSKIIFIQLIFLENLFS